MERILFFHSRALLDPKAKGKRMTICCVIKDSVMSYGISGSHPLDVKSWNKRCGRVLAEARARTTPIFERQKPLKMVKVQFIEDCHNIVISNLREKLGGKAVFKKKMDAIILKRIKELKSLTSELETINNFYQKIFVEPQIA